jgi:hypothetical protein
MINGIAPTNLDVTEDMVNELSIPGRAVDTSKAPFRTSKLF